MSVEVKAKQSNHLFKHKTIALFPIWQTQRSFFQTGDGPNVFRYNPRSGDDVFGEIFGSSSRTVNVGAGEGMGSADGVFGWFREAARKASPIENKLPCSLEELYKGATKKMKISREILVASG